MFRSESCTHTYRYCASNWKPLVKEARDYLLAMIPIVNLIFLKYRCHQAQKHIASPEVQANIRHFFEVMKICNGITAIAAVAGIFHAIYCIQKRSIGITGIPPFLSIYLGINSALLEYNQRQIFKKIKSANNAALQKAVHAATEELADYDAKWRGLLSPQQLIWINRMFRDCEPVTAAAVSIDHSKKMECYQDVMGPPLRLNIIKWGSEENAGLFLKLCGTDENHSAQALVHLEFREYSITELSFRIDNTPRLENLFFDTLGYRIQKNEQPTRQIEALNKILQGETYEFNGIHWRLDSPPTETKNPRT